MRRDVQIPFYSLLGEFGNRQANCEFVNPLMAVFRKFTPADNGQGGYGDKWRILDGRKP